MLNSGSLKVFPIAQDQTQGVLLQDVFLSSDVTSFQHCTSKSQLSQYRNVNEVWGGEKRKKDRKGKAREEELREDKTSRKLHSLARTF